MNIYEQNLPALYFISRKLNLAVNSGDIVVILGRKVGIRDEKGGLQLPLPDTVKIVISL